MDFKILTQEYLQELFSYKDGELFWKKARKGINIGDKTGGNKKHYKSLVIDGKRYYVHRLIFMYHYGYFPAEIDHIDGNKFNNKIENLRACTRQENAYNTKLRFDNKSKIKGVSWNKALKKWLLQISVNKKRLYLGYFDDLKEAELKAIDFRKKQHQGFAKL